MNWLRGLSRLAVVAATSLVTLVAWTYFAYALSDFGWQMAVSMSVAGWVFVGILTLAIVIWILFGFVRSTHLRSPTDKPQSGSI